MLFCFLLAFNSKALTRNWVAEKLFSLGSLSVLKGSFDLSFAVRLIHPSADSENLSSLVGLRGPIVVRLLSAYVILLRLSAASENLSSPVGLRGLTVIRLLSAYVMGL